jgi:hypothetical protein
VIDALGLGFVRKDLQYGDGQQGTARKRRDISQHPHGFCSFVQLFPVKPTFIFFITIQLKIPLNWLAIQKKYRKRNEEELFFFAVISRGT